MCHTHTRRWREVLSAGTFKIRGRTFVPSISIVLGHFFLIRDESPELVGTSYEILRAIINVILLLWLSTRNQTDTRLNHRQKAIKLFPHRYQFLPQSLANISMYYQSMCQHKFVDSKVRYTHVGITELIRLFCFIFPDLPRSRFRESHHGLVGVLYSSQRRLQVVGWVEKVEGENWKFN